MIKITGGTERGKSLFILKNQDLRPTSAKVKQALFNILGEKIIHSNFLDLFAGSGAVGIEALSRGADRSTFVEKNKNHFTLLKKNIDRFQFSQKTSLFCLDVFKFENKGDLYDIVFLDPPYLTGLPEKLLPVLGGSDMIQKSGLMVVEHFKKISLKDEYAHFSLLKHYAYGDTILSVYQCK
ncbi:MAG: 16S rRNA (guanine(966)-N(2))-methyltransferase RsmD [Nitrospiria bacterium]